MEVCDTKPAPLWWTARLGSTLAGAGLAWSVLGGGLSTRRTRYLSPQTPHVYQFRRSISKYQRNIFRDKWLNVFKVNSIVWNLTSTLRVLFDVTFDCIFSKSNLVSCKAFLPEPGLGVCSLLQQETGAETAEVLGALLWGGCGWEDYRWGTIPPAVN